MGVTLGKVQRDEFAVEVSAISDMILGIITHQGPFSSGYLEMEFAKVGQREAARTAIAGLLRDSIMRINSDGKLTLYKGDKMEMNHEQRAAFFRKFAEECHKITDVKGKDYAKGESQPANANFSRAANRTGGRMDKYDVLFIYWQKHCQSLEGWFANRKLESEPIKERIKDNINYLLIMASMLQEDGILEDPLAKDNIKDWEDELVDDYDDSEDYDDGLDHKYEQDYDESEPDIPAEPVRKAPKSKGRAKGCLDKSKK